MPPLFSSRSILVVAFALAAAGCGDRTSRDKTPVEPGTLVAGCMERFDKAARLWGEAPVRASFVYDLTELEDERVAQIFGGKSGDGPPRTMTFATGATPDAKAKFLESSRDSGTAMFRSDDEFLLVVNEGPGPFRDVLRAGCDRLRNDLSMLQASFSRAG